MAITARSWVTGELANAAKMNTLRDDILELDAVAGFHPAQYGAITISGGNTTGTATVSPMSNRAIIHFLGWTVETPYQGVRLERTNDTTVTARRNGTSDGIIVNFAISDPRG